MLLFDWNVIKRGTCSAACSPPSEPPLQWNHCFDSRWIFAAKLKHFTDSRSSTATQWQKIAHPVKKVPWVGSVNRSKLLLHLSHDDDTPPRKIPPRIDLPRSLFDSVAPTTFNTVEPRLMGSNQFSRNGMSLKATGRINSEHGVTSNALDPPS